jgi:hypothetical protein
MSHTESRYANAIAVRTNGIRAAHKDHTMPIARSGVWAAQKNACCREKYWSLGTFLDTPSSMRLYDAFCNILSKNRSFQVHTHYIPAQAINAATNTITFREPINIDIPANDDAELINWTPNTNVGLEDVVIRSAWENVAEPFGHHSSSLHNYGYQALLFKVWHCSLVPRHLLSGGGGRACTPLPSKKIKVYVCVID